jgi:hypothetical protein
VLDNSLFYDIINYKENEIMIKVESMYNKKGNKVVNQFILYTDEGRYFQSYNSIIAFIPYDKNKKRQLDKNTWAYSVTTSKYRNLFLNETTKQTEQKLKQGIYELTDLNN